MGVSAKTVTFAVVMGPIMLAMWLVMAATYPLLVLFVWWMDDGNPLAGAANYLGDFGRMLWDTRPA